MSVKKFADLVTTPGIILGTERFEDCVSFYRDTLELPVWFEKPGLVCLRFGNGYLMIETGGFATQGRKLNIQNPTMLRLNVTDVKAAAALLEAKGVSVALAKYDWGEVGTFVDPDGNAVELKNSDDPYFASSSGMT